MAALTEEQKAFVVQRLACFDGPQAVTEAVKEAFGVEIARSHVYAYDPTRPGFDLGEKWRVLFEETRKRFLENASEIGIAHKSVRLRKLDEMLGRAISMRNYALAAQLMEQAAKETGNAYTNRRELTGKDGSPLPAQQSAVAIFALPDNGRG